ncbi:SpoIID/LytB domain-containing protein [Nocardioides aromaticivorans]|uniref:SpoIID/LytB domain-containing protein n=1 Tax=Nocardioides aromaticivorans TaxID=200618 RepID=A0ABX7PNS9_9ACTN|nr:SpoIID/LytB domain-containing protein [Nocardioides aromaticivorans]QSR27633.1 SpoIID/LytB domain-containing protein [Nocardioides aromaticivorans]
MRLIARAALTALATVAPLAVVPGVVAPGPAVASAAGAAEFQLDGRGWGHGKGMSQWGAQGAATDGLGFRQIVNFYYPGTRVGSATGDIRVLLTAETRQALVVGHRSGLSVRSVSSRASYPLSRAGASRWRITPSSDNATSRVWVYTDAWHLVRSIAGQAEFVAPSMRLYLPSGSKVYRGKLRSASAGGQRDVVNIVSLETYLRGVVPREMPALWKAEALKAQAVAARSYAAYERANSSRGHFDVYDTTQSQVYGGAGDEQPQTDAAIAATRGEIRAYGGTPAFTQFSSSNGGWTVKGSQPYLVARADPYDPVRTWHWTLTQAELRAAAPGIGTATAVTVVARDGHGDWGGRAVTVRVTGTLKTVDVPADTFRSRIGLLSTYFRRV